MNTPTPWRQHEIEANTIVGPAGIAIALFEAHSRTAEENADNCELAIQAVNSRGEMLRCLKAADLLLTDIFQDEKFRTEDNVSTLLAIRIATDNLQSR